MSGTARRLALVTGASSGIGRELAGCCAEEGFDLIIAADEPAIEEAAVELRRRCVTVHAVQTDLATADGVERLHSSIGGRPVDVLLANAGRGLGRGFLDQDAEDWRRVVNTNITGTLILLQKVGRDMRARGHGRILITGSIPGFMPGTYQAVFNCTKAFLDSFSFALRHELADSGVSVTCLMPGATETGFFERADMMDTTVGTAKKANAADVARAGFKAMMKGDGKVVSGWINKLQSAIASIVPAGRIADVHRSMAQPGTQTGSSRTGAQSADPQWWTAQHPQR